MDISGQVVQLFIVFNTCQPLISHYAGLAVGVRPETAPAPLIRLATNPRLTGLRRM